MTDTKRTVVTIISLVVFFPIGLVLMFVWSRWPVWIKIAITLGFCFLTVLAGKMMLNIVAYYSLYSQV